MTQRKSIEAFWHRRWRQVLLTAVLAVAILLAVWAYMSGPHRQVSKLLNEARNSLQPESRTRRFLRNFGLGAPEKQGVFDLARQLADLGPEIVPDLIEALDDEHEQVRIVAALALGGIGDERAVEPLLAKAQDPATYTNSWWAVTRALARLGDRRAVEPMIEALPDPRRADWAALCLVDLKDPRAIEPLTEMFRNPRRPEESRAAAAALAKLGAVEPLLEGLASTRLTTRLYAIQGLGQAREPRALELIRPLVNDPDDRIRNVAVEAVRRIEKSL